MIVGWRVLMQCFPSVRGDLPLPRMSQTFVVGWSGMRGLVTLATALRSRRPFRSEAR